MKNTSIKKRLLLLVGGVVMARKQKATRVCKRTTENKKKNKKKNGEKKLPEADIVVESRVRFRVRLLIDISRGRIIIYARALLVCVPCDAH